MAEHRAYMYRAESLSSSDWYEPSEIHDDIDQQQTQAPDVCRGCGGYVRRGAARYDESEEEPSSDSSEYGGSEVAPFLDALRLDSEDDSGYEGDLDGEDGSLDEDDLEIPRQDRPIRNAEAHEHYDAIPAGHWARSTMGIEALLAEASLAEELGIVIGGETHVVLPLQPRPELPGGLEYRTVVEVEWVIELPEDDAPAEDEPPPPYSRHEKDPPPGYSA